MPACMGPMKGGYREWAVLCSPGRPEHLCLNCPASCPPAVQMGVFQTTLTGLLDLGDGRSEPATLHFFLKGMRHAEVTPAPLRFTGQG